MVKPTMKLRDLQRKKLCQLRETLEADLSFENVSVKDMADWISKNSEPFDDKDIPYEYNPLGERFIIKYMPHPTHDSLQSFFTQTAFGSLVEIVGLSKAHGLVTVGSGTSMYGTNPLLNSSNCIQLSQISMATGANHKSCRTHT